MAHVAATTAAMAIAMAERRVVEQLRGKLATSHERATGFVPERNGDEHRLHGLLDRGVVVEAAPGRYWLNERALKRRAAGWRVMLVVVLALLAVMLGAILAGAMLD